MRTSEGPEPRGKSFLEKKKNCWGGPTEGGGFQGIGRAKKKKALGKKGL